MSVPANDGLARPLRRVLSLIWGALGQQRLCHSHFADWHGASLSRKTPVVVLHASPFPKVPLVEFVCLAQQDMLLFKSSTADVSWQTYLQFFTESFSLSFIATSCKDMLRCAIRYMYMQSLHRIGVL